VETLTARQAFEAMELFLEKFYENTHSDDVGGLLGDLQIVGDGMPADPAAWQDWMRCVKTEQLTVSQGFECMKLFLENYYERVHATDTDGLLKSLGVGESNQQPNSASWQTWERSVSEVLKK
jgi:hypothetical protein